MPRTMTHTHAHPVLQPSFPFQITLIPQFYNWRATAFLMLHRSPQNFFFMYSVSYYSNYVFKIYLSWVKQYYCFYRVLSIFISLSLMKMVKPCGFYCPIMHSIVIFRNACHTIAELIMYTYMPTTLICIHIKLQVLL